MKLTIRHDTNPTRRNGYQGDVCSVDASVSTKEDVNKVIAALQVLRDILPAAGDLVEETETQT